MYELAAARVPALPNAVRQRCPRPTRPRRCQAYALAVTNDPGEVES